MFGVKDKNLLPAQIEVNAAIVHDLERLDGVVRQLVAAVNELGDFRIGVEAALLSLGQALAQTPSFNRGMLRVGVSMAAVGRPENVSEETYQRVFDCLLAGFDSEAEEQAPE